MARTPNPVKFQLWKDRVIAFKASGQTVAVFCKNLPCSVNSFYAWKKRIEIVQDSAAGSLVGLRLLFPLSLVLEVN